MRTLLVDTDSLIYAAAAAHETCVQWDPETFTVHGDFDAAKAQLEGDIGNLKSTLGATVVILALSDYTDPWRKKVLPSYKANRKDIRKPVLLGPLRDYVKEAHGDRVFQRSGLEGDDVLGILATAEKPPAPVVGERVVCSIDKDMKTIPGKHFCWKGKRASEEVTEVTLEQADHWHMVQTLTGDPVDGYKGCPGIGPVRAQKILGAGNKVSEMWPKVVEAYLKEGLGAEDALTQARVARICRASDYDFKKKAVRLWEPK